MHYINKMFIFSASIIIISLSCCVETASETDSTKCDKHDAGQRMETKLEEQQQDIDELKREMEILVSKMEEKDEEIFTMRNIIVHMETKFIRNFEELHTKTNAVDNLKKDIENIVAKSSEQASQLQTLTESPFSYVCGFQDSFFHTHENIPYDYIFYEYANELGSEGGLDLASGDYYAPFPGTYIITYSLYSSNDFDDHYVDIHLNKNGEAIPETYHTSKYTGPSGSSYEQGGRTLILHLDQGERVSLYCSYCSAGVFTIMTCFQLVHPDIVKQGL